MILEDNERIVSVMVEDAKPGLYVVKDDEPIEGLKNKFYQPKLVKRVVKTIRVVTDQGRLFVRSLTADEWEGSGSFAMSDYYLRWLDILDDKHISEEMYHGLFVAYLNSFHGYMDDAINELIDGSFEIPECDFSPASKKLAIALRKWDDTTEFIAPEGTAVKAHCYSYEEDGDTYYAIEYFDKENS